MVAAAEIVTELGQVADVAMAAADGMAAGDRIKDLTKQLDSFHKKDLFLGKFRMLTRSERRRGGVPL